MAQHLEDVYLRRTGRMLFSRDNCRNWLEPLASEMAGLLGWSAERRSEEIAHTVATIDGMFVFRNRPGSAAQPADTELVGRST
ncbi:MAG: hypothetical protein JO057_11160 [Chloroflexi bacterium]|nr:hypothetical protein [Chloroflexota bacterium]